METIKCENCQNINDPGMVFCTNCGRPISANTESRTPTLPKIETPVEATIERPRVGAKKSGLWIFGLLGCLGLTGVFVVGLIAAGIYAGSMNKVQLSPANSNEDKSVSNRQPDKTEPDERKSAEKDLLEILNDRREAGKFKQVTAKNVPAKDYFPRALGAAQATYHNGSRYVSVSIGKYPDFEPARKDFDEQFASVKKKGRRGQNFTARRRRHHSRRLSNQGKFLRRILHEKRFLLPPRFDRRGGAQGFYRKIHNALERSSQSRLFDEFRSFAESTARNRKSAANLTNHTNDFLLLIRVNS